MAQLMPKLTDAGGLRYSPFEEVVQSSGVASPFGYTGEPQNRVTDLVYLRARYYNPYLNQFQSRDPFPGYAKLPASQNGYSYVHNNPVNYSDPSGLCIVGYSGEVRMNQYPYGTSGICANTGHEKPVIISREEWGAVDPTVGTLSPADINMFDLQSYWDVGYNEGFYDPTNNEGGYVCYSQLRPNEPLADILDTIVIHHEGDSQTYDIRQVQLKHMIENGWTDIGYHYAIDLDGQIFEGRDIDVRGSHVTLENTGNIGILFLGDFNPGIESIEDRFGLVIPDIDDHPSFQLVLSAVKLIRWLDFKYGIDNVVGHRDVPNNFTVCPGEYCVQLIPYFNSIVQEQ